MAPVAIESSPSYTPTIVVAAHLFSVGYLSLVAVRTIFRSYIALPPSSATRHREPLRRGHVQIFSSLALVSLAVAGYFEVRFASLSYRVWATERGVELPDSLFGDKGALRGGEHPGRLHVVRWLDDTPYYRDSLEIVAEKTRHFWWSQQVHAGFISWSIYLAIEGQRRKILNLWAFQALAQMVSLSYAQNLFFVVVLLTPVPLPRNVRDLTRTSVPVTSSRYSQFLEKIIPKKPDGFLPKPALYISLLLSSFASVFLIPYAANTPSFFTVSWISRTIHFFILLLPHITPISWGTVPTHPHDSHLTYTTLFRTISALSALLHIKSSALALFYNTSESTYYRHSLLHPFQEEHRSAFGRGSTAVGRVFGAVREHPAVGSVSWDVLLSSLSLGVWAGIRGLDTMEMLRSIMPFITSAENDYVEDSIEGQGIKIGTSAKEKEKEASQRPKKSVSQSHRHTGRPKKIEQNSAETQDTKVDSGIRRRSGRSGVNATFGEEGKSTDNGQESSKNEPSIRTPLSAAKTEDGEYQLVDEDLVEEGDEDAEGDAEVAALAWGIITIGGLGGGSTAVYGAEMISR